MSPRLWDCLSEEDKKKLVEDGSGPPPIEEEEKAVSLDIVEEDSKELERIMSQSPRYRGTAGGKTL